MNHDHFDRFEMARSAIIGDSRRVLAVFGANGDSVRLFSWRKELKGRDRLQLGDLSTFVRIEDLEFLVRIPPKAWRRAPRIQTFWKLGCLGVVETRYSRSGGRSSIDCMLTWKTYRSRAALKQVIAMARLGIHST